MSIGVERERWRGEEVEGGREEERERDDERTWLLDAVLAAAEVPEGERDQPDADEDGGDCDPGYRSFAQAAPGGREDGRGGCCGRLIYGRDETARRR